jgi:uncharacterized membrane protein
MSVFFGFIIGVIGLLKGEIEVLKIHNRKDALKFIGIAIILVFAGSFIVGRDLWLY